MYVKNFVRCPGCGRLMTMVPYQYGDSGNYRYYCRDCGISKESYGLSFGEQAKKKGVIETIPIGTVKRRDFYGLYSD